MSGKFSAMYEDLVADLKKAIATKDVTLTLLVRKGLTASTAANISAADTEKYKEFMAINVYKTCKIIDKSRGTTTYVKKFKRIFEESDVLFNKWYSKITKNPSLSTYIASRRRNGKYKGDNQFNYKVRSMLDILDYAAEEERKEQERVEEEIKRYKNSRKIKKT